MKRFSTKKETTAKNIKEHSEFFSKVRIKLTPLFEKYNEEEIIKVIEEFVQEAQSLNNYEANTNYQNLEILLEKFKNERKVSKIIEKFKKANGKDKKKIYQEMINIIKKTDTLAYCIPFLKIVKLLKPA
jgi:hypothetical protein